VVAALRLDAFSASNRRSVARKGFRLRRGAAISPKHDSLVAGRARANLPSMLIRRAT